MRIHLQKPFFSPPQLHRFRTSPAGPFAVSPTNVENLKSIVAGVGWWRLLRCVLPADSKTQQLRVMCLLKTISDCCIELPIAIGRDRDEDAMLVKPLGHLVSGYDRAGIGWIRACGCGCNRIKLSVHGGVEFKQLQIAIAAGAIGS